MLVLFSIYVIIDYLINKLSNQVFINIFIIKISINYVCIYIRHVNIRFNIFDLSYLKTKLR